MVGGLQGFLAHRHAAGLFTQQRAQPKQQHSTNAIDATSHSSTSFSTDSGTTGRQFAKRAQRPCGSPCSARGPWTVGKQGNLPDATSPTETSELGTRNGLSALA